MAWQIASVSNRHCTSLSLRVPQPGAFLPDSLVDNLFLVSLVDVTMVASIFESQSPH